jgi:flagellar protein FliO/FliZ
VYMLLLCAVLCTATVAAQSTNSQSATQAQSEEKAHTTQQPAATPEGSGAGGGTAEPDEVREEDLAIRDTGTPEVALEGGLTQFSFWDFLRMFLVLGGVIGAIYGVFFVLKRMGNPRFQGNSLISVISTQNLQGNRALHLVEVGNEVFLIGSSEGGVELVGKLEDQETLDQVKLYRSEMVAGGKSFQGSLRDIFFRSGSSGEEAAEEETDRSAGAALFLQRQRERLKNM